MSSKKGQSKAKPGAKKPGAKKEEPKKPSEKSKAEKPKQGTKKKDREEVKATVKTDIKPKNEKRHLAHDFTDDELRSLGDELANETMNLQNLESEKKSVVSQYKSKADEIKAKIQTISANIAARREFRWTDCEVRFNEPKTGKKTVVRLDNGSTVEVANMTPEEMQLKINLPEAVDKETGEIIQAKNEDQPKSSGLTEELPEELIQPDFEDSVSEDEDGFESEEDDF